MEQELKNSLQVLQAGGLLLYPTDTVWGIGCDATNEDAVEKVYQLKKRHESKALICLVSGYTMLESYVGQVPARVKKILDSAHKPTTVIYPNPRGVAKNLLAPDGSMAIRISGNPFNRALLDMLGKPLVSTSANISGEPTASTFDEISVAVKSGVDYVVNWHREQGPAEPSSVVLVNKDGSLTYLRK